MKIKKDFKGDASAWTGQILNGFDVMDMTRAALGDDETPIFVRIQDAAGNDDGVLGLLNDPDSVLETSVTLSTIMVDGDNYTAEQYCSGIEDIITDDSEGAGWQDFNRIDVDEADVTYPLCRFVRLDEYRDHVKAVLKLAKEKQEGVSALTVKQVADALTSAVQMVKEYKLDIPGHLVMKPMVFSTAPKDADAEIEAMIAAAKKEASKR